SPILRTESQTAPVFPSLNRDEKIAKILSSIGEVEASRKDDFNLLANMEDGLAIELQAMGIRTYEQLSRLTEEDCDLLDRILDLPFGTVAGFNWSQQAINFINK